MFVSSRQHAQRLFLWGSGVAVAAVVGCSSTGSTNDGGSGGVDGRAGSATGAVGGGVASSGGSTQAAGGSGASTGGLSSSGGVSSAGGPSAGAPATGGALSNGGTTSAGGSGGMGGKGGVGGTGGMNSAAGASGAESSSSGPCDIYATANTPCVAAHSTTRALYGAYNGPLYQVRRASDKATKDVPVLGAGGFVDIAVQDTFCSGTTCTIASIYDQSPNKNDLLKSGVATWLPNGGVEANADSGKITLSGHTAHGIYVTGNSNVAYRNNATKGVAKGDQAEAMYMVVDGKRSSSVCCFDYGNAETSGKDDGNGTMEALYWGTDTTWGGTGQGSGPWVAADLENGIFKGDKGGWQSQAINTPSAKSVIAAYATAMLKGPSGNHFTLKAGDAQTGTLVTMWDGVRPSPGYSPKKLQGAIIVGTGGDGSNGGTGTFFEGAMTNGNPPDSVDALVQANIVAAGYGH
ncbi:MAG: arabinofuranosidase catalytic domain-containing protein [Polyangiaceae bacterium]